MEWSREFDCEICVEAGIEGPREEEEEEPELLSCPSLSAIPNPARCGP